MWVDILFLVIGILMAWIAGFVLLDLVPRQDRGLIFWQMLFILVGGMFIGAALRG